MKVTGIIVEYNPFHNGHQYHIEQARSLTDPDVLVAVMSGNYCQRGDISIIDKFEKTKVALEHGVDLVIELPYLHTVQNGYVFGKHAVDLLKECNVDTIVFGSETNNIEELKKYAQLEVDVTHLKQLLHDGNSYPKAYGLLSSSLYPNDMLAVTYLKAIQNTNIKPISIQRTNDYHGTDLEVIASATAIRNAIQNGKDVSMATPLKIEDPIFNKDLYSYLQKLLFTSSPQDLKNIFLVSEGIENLLIKNAQLYDSYEEFIKNTVSRRYTRSRIQRILLNIALQIKSEEVNQLKENNYVRVLGFNNQGQELLKQLKKDENKKIITQFKNIPEDYKKIEWKASLLYSSLTKHPQEYLKKELKGPIIIK